MIIIESDLIRKITNKMKIFKLFFVMMLIFFNFKKYFETLLLLVFDFECELLEWTEIVAITIMRKPESNKINLKTTVTEHTLMLSLYGWQWQHGISNNSSKLFCLVLIQQLTPHFLKKLSNLSIQISKVNCLFVLLMKCLIDDNRLDKRFFVIDKLHFLIGGIVHWTICLIYILLNQIPAW